jgi:hypothetical protein
MGGGISGRKEFLMKRRVVTALALVVFCYPAVAVAGTDTTLSGTAEWSTQSSPELGLEATTTTIHGAFAGKLGRGTYAGTLDGGSGFTTPQCGPVCEAVTGTFTVTSRRGDFTAVIQPGSVVALEDIASFSWRRFTLTLSVMGGTRSYANANGTLTLSYTSTWEHEFVGGVFVNSITDSGTLSGNPR